MMTRPELRNRFRKEDVVDVIDEPFTDLCYRSGNAYQYDAARDHDDIVSVTRNR